MSLPFVSVHSLLNPRLIGGPSRQPVALFNASYSLIKINRSSKGGLLSCHDAQLLTGVCFFNLSFSG